MTTCDPEEIVTGRPVEILLVEDSPSDARLTQEALCTSGVPNRVHVVEDGDAAIDFLRRRDAFSDAPRPDLILLDLNLPKRTGSEVLEEIKRDAELKQIPVVILTSSADEQDVNQAYALSANCYIIKPLDVDRFLDQVTAVSQFWFSTVRLPHAAF